MKPIPSPTVPSSTPAAHPTSGAMQVEVDRGAHHAVEIAQVQEALGWGESSWQVAFLKTVDAASAGRSRNDGKVTAKEVEAYLEAPSDSKYLSSTAMQVLRDDLVSKTGLDEAEGMRADAFDHAWEDRVGREADLIGNQDGHLSREELSAFLDRAKANATGPEGTFWVADEKASMLESELTDFTGGEDFLRVDGPRVGTELRHDYSRSVMDDGKNVAQWVSYELSAADLAEVPEDVDRSKSTWKRDPALPYPGVVDSDYVGTGFDRGHLRPAEDSADQAAMDESHLMTNVAPQYANFNQQTWRTLEQAISELVAATGGKAEVVTGNLYLDAKGNPLPPEELQVIGASDRKIAVPTHCFKAVRLTTPDGKVTELGFLVPNDADSPVGRDEIGALLRGSKVSVDALEGMLGQNVFGDRAPDLEAEADPVITFPNAGHYHAAQLLWPQGVPLDTPWLPSLGWHDSFPDWFRDELRLYDNA